MEHQHIAPQSYRQLHKTKLVTCTTEHFPNFPTFFKLLWTHWRLRTMSTFVIYSFCQAASKGITTFVFLLGQCHVIEYYLLLPNPESFNLRRIGQRLFFWLGRENYQINCVVNRKSKLMQWISTILLSTNFIYSITFQ